MQGIVLDSVSKIFGRPRILGRLARTLAKTETYALRDVSFAMPAGKVLVLLGPNGSGKTTTLKLLSTIFFPDNGSVLVNGWDTRQDAGQVRKQISIAISSERSFYPRLTARENLEFFASLDDVPRRTRKQRIEAALQRTDLAELRDVQIMKFSSGMHQRLALARALMKQPSAVLLDEPTRSLDPGATARYWELIRDLPASGTSVVLASHNFEEAIAVGDSVAILQRGELIFYESTDGLNAERLKSLYADLTEVSRFRDELVEAAS